ncbi:MAG: hypothetical protein JO159_19775 [Acidobacteria bacterium]|nr:hypothetical protein [Acidobacteriota bacterium]MBV9622984.1 hypothetical protein [Acidobacteriota bacterium]
MLGDVLGESKGRRIVRRVLSSDPLKVEVSFEDTGTMLGVDVNGMGTYTSEARPDGSLYGEGQGAMITADGEPIMWKGSGAGKLLAGGAVSYRGILYYRTPSQKLARLNNACGVFEYEVDAAGNTTSKVWQWK